MPKKADLSKITAQVIEVVGLPNKAIIFDTKDTHFYQYELLCRANDDSIFAYRFKDAGADINPLNLYKLPRDKYRFNRNPLPTPFVYHKYDPNFAEDFEERSKLLKSLGL